jgi:hypothetical protein
MPTEWMCESPWGGPSIVSQAAGQLLIEEPGVSQWLVVQISVKSSKV